MSEKTHTPLSVSPPHGSASAAARRHLHWVERPQYRRVRHEHVAAARLHTRPARSRSLNWSRARRKLSRARAARLLVRVHTRALEHTRQTQLVQNARVWKRRELGAGHPALRRRTAQEEVLGLVRVGKAELRMSTACSGRPRSPDSTSSPA